MSERQVGTNAADSAPGVNDGPAMGRTPEPLTKPGGRGRVWVWLLISLAVLLAVFIATPRSDRNDEGAAVTAGGTRGEIENSTVPGASDPSRPADAR